MLKNDIFCEMAILVVFKGFLLVKNLEILIQIVPDSPIYHYSSPEEVCMKKYAFRSVWRLYQMEEIKEEHCCCTTAAVLGRKQASYWKNVSF